MKSPCYKCSERSAVCHADCERYKAFQEQLTESKRKEKAENEFKDYKRNQYERMRKQSESKTYASFMKRRGG